MKLNIFLLFLLTFFAINCLASNVDIKTKDSSNEYLKGFVSSLCKYNYNLPENAILVKDRTIYINKNKINNYSPNNIKIKLEQATSNIKNVRVIIVEKDSTLLTEFKSDKVDKISDGLMPNYTLFEPLIADPKWPRFTLAYHYHKTKHRSNRSFFAPNFGATFPIFRYSNNFDWEIGIQGGLFGLMDVGVNPTALVNADYFIGLPVTFRSGPWSGLIRPYHLSSHLGDEFMLTDEGKKVKRIDLSYEGIDVILSRNIEGLRLYGGGGYIVNKYPKYYKPWKIQFGSEYYSTETFWDGRLRPVIALDLKWQQHNNWYPGVSVKAGMQLENAVLISNKVLLMIEYYHGKSFHGQFYNKKLNYVGVGLNIFM